MICGFVFASLEPALVLFTRWRAAGRGWRVLIVSLTSRFLTGLLIPTVDLGVPLWMTGLFLGLALTVPLVVVSRRWVGPLGLGAIGGFVIAAIAELAR